MGNNMAEIIYQHIIDSMKVPSIVAFWLITIPQIMGGFKYGDEFRKVLRGVLVSKISTYNIDFLFDQGDDSFKCLFFRMPSVVNKYLEKLRAANNQKGGLDIGSLEAFNKALLLKWK
uniref:Uncharacterized protein n=1 Tax=Lactuca sativa TaxID=4236 RepID=A0A9R1VUZ5_LACSA|nr:hypothetical protein LSAT_V11C400223070 [Lactuca sativa]